MDKTAIEQSGKLFALHLILGELLASSGQDIREMHARLTGILSGMTGLADTPENRACNAMFSAACAEMDAIALFAQKRRERD